VTQPLRAIMVAVSPDGVIGKGGTIPWHYGGDLKRLKRVTMGSTVIMGRVTWESAGKRPLPGRRNIVITKAALDGAECFADIPSALATSEGPVWFLGGSRIYAEAMRYCDLIDVTYVPDRVDTAGAVLFPPIDPENWEAGPLLDHEDEPALCRRVYTRKAAPASRPIASASGSDPGHG
jgi:dihydrofolate reductase